LPELASEEPGVKVEEADVDHAGEHEKREQAAKALWKQVQQFRREAGSFFTAAERQQLDRIVEPPAPER
jgi:cytochrome c556